jgi:hypothetical protein
MMIQAHGTGAFFVLILISIAVLLVCLLLLAAAIGSVKPKKASLCIGLVIVCLTGVLVFHSRSGGDFPRIVLRGSMGQNRAPLKVPSNMKIPRK